MKKFWNKLQLQQKLILAIAAGLLLLVMML